MGRPKGAKNKATIEREIRAQAEAAGQFARETGMPKRGELARDRLLERAKIYIGLAAFYQSTGWDTQIVDGARVAVNRNPNFNQAEYKYWTLRADALDKELCQYESPKLSAVAVGEVRKIEVVVHGGLPPRSNGPPPAVPAIAPPMRP